MPSAISPNDLVVHLLNVGFGDAIVLELPTTSSGKNLIAVVDSNDGEKSFEYIKKIGQKRPFDGVAFICATHPHLDHIRGLRKLIRDPLTQPGMFWDSGFRHKSVTYARILQTLKERNIPMVRVSSGMEWYYGSLRITALSPSVALRNRYATYGIDMNNASIVLRLENCADNVVIVESQRYSGTDDPALLREAGTSTVILGGDAEFDSWAQVTAEYPMTERTDQNHPLVRRAVNPLACGVVKVSHHGSMHSTPLDVYERMSPRLAILSSKQQRSEVTRLGERVVRELFPHPATQETLKEADAVVLTTDGKFDLSRIENSGVPGTIVVAVAPGGRPRYAKLGDDVGVVPDTPTAL